VIGKVVNSKLTPLYATIEDYQPFNYIVIEFADVEFTIDTMQYYRWV